MAYDYDYEPNARRGKARKARKSTKRPARKAGKRAYAPKIGSTHKGWVKTADGWEKAGVGKSGARETSRSRRTAAKRPARKAATRRRWGAAKAGKSPARKTTSRKRWAPTKAAKRPTRKSAKGSRRWPAKGQKRRVRAVVAGVEARVDEDLLKAFRILQASRERVYHTSRRVGGKAGRADAAFATAVKAFERLLKMV